MRVESLSIPDIKLLRLDAHKDPRGLFVEVWDAGRMRAVGIEHTWMLDGLSRQTKRGTVRGLHFQTPPMAQAKLVRVARGRVLDVALDIRVGSPHFGRHVVVEMAAEDWTLLYIPIGFAHGFCALEDGTELQYKLSSSYSPENNKLGLLWNDPALGIDWRVSAGEAILADRDRAFPVLSRFESPFRYGAP